MQNRKNFLKTAAIGVAGAIGLTLIPSKGLAESTVIAGPPRMIYPELKYKLSIGRMIEIQNDMTQHFRVHPQTFVATPVNKLHDEVWDNIVKEMDGRKGLVVAHPFWNSEFGYGYKFVITPHQSGVLGVDYRKINKTMQHIIDGTPDPFMDYAEYADEI